MSNPVYRRDWFLLFIDKTILREGHVVAHRESRFRTSVSLERYARVKPSSRYREENYMDCVHGDTEVPDWPMSGGPRENAWERMEQ
jgi:hypothetical protein